MDTDARPTANRSMPPGTIIPELVYDSMEEAAAWLCRVFGFRQRLRIGDHRFQLLVGPDAAIVVVQRSGATPPGDLAHSLMVRVDDVDRHHARATEGGARIVSPPADYPYGERQYTAEDPAGRRWTFSQPIADVDPADWGGALAAHDGRRED